MTIKGQSSLRVFPLMQRAHNPHENYILALPFDILIQKER